MNNELIFNSLKENGISDLVLDNNILTNTTHSAEVDISNFDLKLIFLYNDALSISLTNRTMDSYGIIKIVEAIKIAQDSYNRLAWEVFNLHNQNNNTILNDNDINQLIHDHVIISRVRDSIPPYLLNIYNTLNNYIEYPINSNEETIKNAYHQYLTKLEEEAQTNFNAGGKSNAYVLTDGHSMYKDDHDGFIKLSAIVLVIVNIGIMIATWIIKH